VDDAGDDSGDAADTGDASDDHDTHATDTGNFTYIGLDDLVNLDVSTLESPCSDWNTFNNIIVNIEQWLAILNHPDELSSDLLLLNQVRALIVAAQESTKDVVAEFEFKAPEVVAVDTTETTTGTTTESTTETTTETTTTDGTVEGGDVPVLAALRLTPAFVQLKSKIQLKTQVIQGVFFKEMQHIMAQLKAL